MDTTPQTSRWQRPLLSAPCNYPYLCCFSFFTPCAEFGRNVQRLHHMQNKDCLLYGCLYLLPGFCCYLTHVFRRELREVQAIEGTSVNDVMAHLCCPCCAIMQESEELDHLEDQISRQRRASSTNSAPYVISTQPQPPPDALEPATEETPYDPGDDLHSDHSQPDMARY